LKPAVAIVRSLSRNPVPAPGMLPALLIVVIAIFPCGPLLNWAFFRLRSNRFQPWNSPILLSHTVPERAGITTRIRESTLMF